MHLPGTIRLPLEVPHQLSAVGHVTVSGTPTHGPAIRAPFERIVTRKCHLFELDHIVDRDERRRVFLDSRD
jgi:hypothetical protein